MYQLSDEQLGNLLADLIDIRESLSQQALEQPKDDEGTEFTIGDLLDDQIAFLQGLKSNP